jgi:hypothetical protein
MKHLKIVFCLALISPLLLQAQVDRDFEAYRQAQMQRMAAMKEQHRQGIDSLRNAQNKAFLQMLKREWDYVALQKSGEPFESPKPPTPPSIPEEEVKEVVPIIELPTDTASETPPAPLPIADEPESNLKFLPSIFFRAPTIYPRLTDWPKLNIRGKITNTDISDYWQKATESPDLDDILKYLNQQKEAFNLNDWGIILLVQKITKKNFEVINEQRAFEWLVLIQLGFDLRLMFDENRLYIAYPVKQQVYAKNYFVFDNQRYYLIHGEKTGRLFTYREQFPGAEQSPNLAQLTAVELPKMKASRTFEFDFQSKPYKIVLPFNNSAVDLYQTLPQLELNYYFSEKAHSSFDYNVRRILMPYLDTIARVEDKVRFLHSMVLYSIPYQTDDEQFGYEKFCLPEEVLLYPYADCEDRTFLLNYLIRTLLGLNTIGLHFPGHMSMAVELPNPENFSAVFSFNGKKYVYCDPTYFGADIGRLPDEYRGITAEVIE